MENRSSVDSISSFNVSNFWGKHCDQTDIEDDCVEHFINVFSTVIYTLTFLLGAIANGFVIWIKVFRMEKTYRSILYLHLFISGFIFSLFLPLNIVYFASGTHWPFGNFMCRLNSFILHLNMFFGAFILTLFSIDYCIVVKFPIRYNFHRKPRLASLEVLVVCILALCVTVPYFIFRRTYDCHGTTKCLYSFDEHVMRGLSDVGRFQHQVIVIIAFTAGFVIPFMIICSCIIVTALLYHRKQSSKYTTSLKLIFSIQICFAICWLPYHVFSFLELSSSMENHLDGGIEIGLPIAMTLISVNNCINPLLYAFICPDFKKVFSIRSIFFKNPL
ncbi:chemerin-like receptor 1 [Mixophyes fleayi]|uniref:chemerin-like receptor 1 n=1 Tax=Mixophyes fleayi TaxID=3061075 RepID=UPI003F4DFBC6